MTRGPRFISTPAVWLLLSLLSAISMGYYVSKIWSANQSASFSDLYARWWGAHELLLHGRNPYDPAVAHEIQTVIYGAPVVATYPGDDSDLTGGFAYPIYAAFLLWPTVYWPFSAVRQLFFWISPLALVSGLGLWLYSLRLRLPILQLLAVALFILGSFPAMQAMKLQNLSLIAALFIAAAVASLTANQLALAGALLAASTFKPQLTVGLIPWLAIWTVGDWSRRKVFAGSFLISMLLLTGGGEYYLRGWIPRFLGVVRSYTHYTFAHSLIDLWFTYHGGPFVSGALLLAILALCWRYRRSEAGSRIFFLITSLTLAATLVVIPTLAPHTQLLLVPGILYLLYYRRSVRTWPRLVRIASVSVWVLLGWQWVAAAAMAAIAFWIPSERLLTWWQAPLYTSPLLPLAIMVCLWCMIKLLGPANDLESLHGQRTL